MMAATLPPSRHWDEDFEGTFVLSEPRTQGPSVSSRIFALRGTPFPKLLDRPPGPPLCRTGHGDDIPPQKTIVVGRPGNWRIFQPFVADLARIPCFARHPSLHDAAYTVRLPDEDPDVFEALDVWLHEGQMLAVRARPAPEDVALLVRVGALAARYEVDDLRKDVVRALGAWMARASRDVLAAHDVEDLCGLFHAAEDDEVRGCLVRGMVVLLRTPELRRRRAAWARTVGDDPEIAPRVIEALADLA